MPTSRRVAASKPAKPARSDADAFAILDLLIGRPENLTPEARKEIEAALRPRR